MLGRVDLPERDIHVWVVPTTASEATVATFEKVLDPRERERAARFLFSHLREKFVIAHGALRHLLARYLAIEPAEIRFTHGPKGKPAVDSEAGLEFNMSHSGNLALVAVTLRCPIGVDIEEIRPVSNMQQIVKSYFAPDEAADTEEAFFRAWTRKEASGKAVGDGLLSTVTEGLYLEDLHVMEGYAAAIAYRDRRRPVSVFKLAEPSELLAS